MSIIIKTRRIFETETYQTFDYRMVKNPFYSHSEMIEFSKRRFQYTIPEYIEKSIPVTKTRKKSHIEYQIQCEHCGSLGWVRRKDAKYCSSNCRKLAYRERKERKQK